MRNVTIPVSGVQDRGLTPAGPVRLLFWSCRAPSCVWSAARTASISSVTSANSATPAVRPAQVQMENYTSVISDFSIIVSILDIHFYATYVTMSMHVCLQMPRLRDV